MIKIFHRRKVSPAFKKRARISVASYPGPSLFYLTLLISKYKKSVHPALNVAHRRYPGSWLSPGCLAAPGGSHLVLLHSCPDTVHEAPLRKTQTSTLLTRGSPARTHPRRNITPARADCRYRAPLSPRLHGNFLTN